MAAIIETHRPPTRSAPRPALRLVTAEGGRTIDTPVDLGIGPIHVAAAIAALVLCLLLALAIGNGAFASLSPAPASAPAAAGAGSSASAGSHVVVRAGDTLWTIARRLQPAGDVRPLVDRLVELNGSAPLQPGAQLTLPS